MKIGLVGRVGLVGLLGPGRRVVWILHLELHRRTLRGAHRMLGGSWPLVDEFYHFGTAPWEAARPTDNIDVLFGNHIPMGFSRDRVHVLLSLDTTKTNLEGMPDVVKGGDYPQAWTREYGQGRSFYTALGHRDDIWSNDPAFRAHINGGIRWALGLEQ